MDVSLKKRVITAMLWLPLIILMLFSPEAVVRVAVIIASIICFYEYSNAVGIREYKGIYILGYLGVIVIHFGNYFSGVNLLVALYIYITVLFVMMMVGEKRPTFKDIAFLVLGLVYIPYFLSHIIYIRMMEFGNFYIWLVFIGAFMTDTCAYFTGITVGGKKLCPSISPKKTVSGAIGGIVGCGLSFLLFGVIVNNFFGWALAEKTMNLGMLFIFGMCTGVISEIGDLIASVIKRQFGIKDFGNLLPGHGGILDRCDSIIMVTPFIYLCLLGIGIIG